MRKIKVGDKVVVKRPVVGCMGAQERTGVVIDTAPENDIQGLCEDSGGTLVLLDCGKIWRVNTDALDVLEARPEEKTYTVVLSSTAGDGIHFFENDLQEVMEITRYFLEKGFTVTIVPEEV